MEDKLQELKKLIDSFPVSEGAQLSQTRYDQESTKSDSLDVENDKEYEEDRLDLEEILNQSTNYKKSYIKKVVTSINKLIDGTADVEDVVKTVKQRKKKTVKEVK